VTSAADEVSISLGSNPTEGELSGMLTVAAVDGVATFEGIFIDRVGQGYTLLASAGGLESATSQAFDITRPPYISMGNVELRTFSSAPLLVTLSEPAGAGGQAVSLLSGDPAAVSVPASVLVPEGATTVLTTVESGNVAATVTLRASGAGFETGAAIIAVIARTMNIGLDALVGIGRTNEATVILAEPAPASGVTVALSSSDPAIISVTPSSVFIPAGEREAAFTISGVAEGVVVITATAQGYEDATVQAGGTNTTVSIGTIPVLAPGESRSLPISLSEPAPPGGLTILLASDDPSVATVQPSIFIAAGSQVPASNAQVTGVAVGTAVIRAGAEGFAPDARTATVRALTMSISPSPVTIFAGLDEAVRMTLSRAAPAGGLTVTLTSLDPAVFTVPASAFIPEGQSSATIAATGVAPGSSTLLAESPAIQSASAVVTVNTPPSTLLMSNAAVGRDLQVSHTVRLQETPIAPVDITVTVAAGSTALLSRSRTAVGTTSITFTGVTNTSSQTFYVQGLEEGTTTITAQAAGYDDRPATVTVTPSGFRLSSSNFSTTTFSANTTLTLESYRLNANGSISNYSTYRQEVRAGVSVAVPVTSSDTEVGTITVSPVTFAGGTGSQKNTQFNPLSSGTSTVSIAQPDGFMAPADGRTTLTATVTAPNIIFSPTTMAVGKDLQLSATVRLEAAPPEPVDITVTVASGSTALLSTSRTAVGTTSITFTGVTGTSSQTFYVQGMELGNTTITAQAAAYNTRQATVSVTPSGFRLSNSNFSTTTFSGNTTLTLESYRLNADGSISNYSTYRQEVRAGLSVAVPVSSSQPSVGTITVSPVVFAGGTGNNKTTQFNPLTVGTSTVSIAQPDGFTAPSDGRTSLTATVNAPNIIFSPTTMAVGRDLQMSGTVRLEAAPPEPVDITITIASGSAALLSTSRTAVGTTSITFTGVTGTSSLTFHIQGVEEGTTSITAQAAGYNDRQTTVSVTPSGFRLANGNFSTRTSSTNTTLTLESYRLNADGSISNFSTYRQEIRAGVSVQVPVTSSDTEVGTITVSPVVFGGGTGSQKTTQFKPLSAGSTTISVTQPTGFRAPTNASTSATATVTDG
jgi:hypothetical protein